MNTRKDKIALLKEVRAGKINPEEIPLNPLIISDPQQVWYGLMILADMDEAGEPDTVVFVGEAKSMLQKLQPEFDRLAEQYRAEEKGENIA